MADKDTHPTGLRADRRATATRFVSWLDFADAMEFCRGLPDRAGVVAIPSAVFYDDHPEGRTLVCFAFCKRPEVLKEALARLSVLGR
jgi:N-succinyldiaminopimelate aminotransferase